MTELTARTRFDAIGVGVPIVCTVQCLAAPLLLPIAAPLASEAVEIGLFAATVVTAAVLIVSGLWRHGHAGPATAAAAGLAIWGAGLAELVPMVSEEATTVTGALLVAGALVWNGVLRRPTACGYPAAP